MEIYNYCCPPPENNEYKVQKKLIYLYKDIGVTAAQSLLVYECPRT